MPADRQTRDLLYICCDILNVSLNLGQSNSSAEHRVIQERRSHQDLILMSASVCIPVCSLRTTQEQSSMSRVGGPPEGQTVYVLSGNTRVNLLPVVHCEWTYWTTYGLCYWCRAAVRWRRTQEDWLPHLLHLVYNPEWEPHPNQAGDTPPPGTHRAPTVNDRASPVLSNINHVLS